ncbi:hypothetical protein BDZ91DRAFT_542764 [Kalaharituber pfeilii]|nr:hypothetical protein BDZ91DRAFT_542764 [Kalaharituber pfeilii]
MFLFIDNSRAQLGYLSYLVIFLLFGYASAASGLQIPGSISRLYHAQLSQSRQSSVDSTVILSAVNSWHRLQQVCQFALWLIVVRLIVVHLA